MPSISEDGGVQYGPRVNKELVQATPRQLSLNVNQVAGCCLGRQLLPFECSVLLHRGREHCLGCFLTELQFVFVVQAQRALTGRRTGGVCHSACYPHLTLGT